MLHSSLDLDDVSVEDIMVHRRNVTMIDADQPAAQIVDEVLASPYTRLPLWREEPDNIIGVLHVKALLRAVQANLGDVDKLDIVRLASPAWFIPESTSLLAQLPAFRARRGQFPLVWARSGPPRGYVPREP